MPDDRSSTSSALPGPEEEDLSAVVFGAFTEILRRHRQLLHRAFSRQDLHPAQALCIRVLASRGELTQRDLADEMLLSRPTITRIVQRMERAGLVTRRADAADQRQVLVALTEAGSCLQAGLDVAISEYLTATLSRLPENDRRELARILPRWRELVDEALDSPPDPPLAAPRVTSRPDGTDP